MISIGNNGNFPSGANPPLSLARCQCEFSRLFLFNLVISKGEWESLMKNNGWNPVELRDTRYNQIIHMVSAAKGAEDFYTTEVAYLLNIYIYIFFSQRPINSISLFHYLEP